MNKAIIRPSGRFKKDILKKKLLSDTVNEFLHRLNTNIEIAHKNNRVGVVMQLPIGFNIPEYINYKNFQTEIYYNIVTILEEKGYGVKVKAEEPKWHIKVTWCSNEDDDTIEEMKRKLKKIMY